MTDEPRFALLDLDRSYIYASIADPDQWNTQGDERERALELQAAAKALSDDDVRWIADNFLAEGGVGACDLRCIDCMMVMPDHELKDLVGQMAVPAQMMTMQEASRLEEAAFGLGDEEVATVISEIEAAVLARGGLGDEEPRHPVHLLTRAELLDLFSATGGRDLWDDASDEELHRACLIENAVIRSGDDTSEDAFYLLEALLERRSAQA